MSEPDHNNSDQRRDALLLQLLKTPPQPRPKRDRKAKTKPTSGGVESTPSETPANH